MTSDKTFKKPFLILFLASLVCMGYSQNLDQSSLTQWNSIVQAYQRKTGLEVEFEISFRFIHLQLIEGAGHLFKVFSVDTKRKDGVFKFLRFRKAPFLRRISLEGRPNRRNHEAAFSSFSVV